LKEGEVDTSPVVVERALELNVRSNVVVVLALATAGPRHLTGTATVLGMSEHLAGHQAAAAAAAASLALEVLVGMVMIVGDQEMAPGESRLVKAGRLLAVVDEAVMPSGTPTASVNEAVVAARWDGWALRMMATGGVGHRGKLNRPATVVRGSGSVALVLAEEEEEEAVTVATGVIGLATAMAKPVSAQVATTAAPPQNGQASPPPTLPRVRSACLLPTALSWPSLVGLVVGCLTASGGSAMRSNRWREAPTTRRRLPLNWTRCLAAAAAAATPVHGQRGPNPCRRMSTSLLGKRRRANLQPRILGVLANRSPRRQCRLLMIKAPSF